MDELKYIYNYNLEECNRLLKRKIIPVGCGYNYNTESVYHVYYPTKKYFEIIEIIRQEMSNSIDRKI